MTVSECNGQANVVCGKCKRVLVLRCNCTFLRPCRCAEPQPIDPTLPKEADTHERP